MRQHYASLKEKRGPIQRRYAMFVLEEEMWCSIKIVKNNYIHIILQFGALSSVLTSVVTDYHHSKIVCPILYVKNTQKSPQI